MTQVRVMFVLAMLCTPIVTYAPPTRPEISGIGFVRLRVANIEKSRKFYGDLLELSRSNSWCFRSDATCYYLNPLHELEILPSKGTASLTAVDTIGFWVGDVRQLRSYLSALGVKSEKVIPNSSAEECIEIRDPEDHRIAFVSLTGGVTGSLLSSSGEISHRMIHAGIIVHDRAAEDRFYKDILGFHVYWHGGMKEGEDNWIDMQVPDGTDWIEYMLKVPENATHKQLGVMNHIALGVPDIKAAREQLVKNGWTGTEQPKIGRDGKWQLNLYDPDETRVELMEFTPTQKPCCSEYTGPHPKP
jgi:catechol 2,3-dioxygenase-like lactoylglutathione lyase family enzyme